MMTVTTVELAREMKLTPKSVRQAIHRGDLIATRKVKGTGRTMSATEFEISRRSADEWKARRALKRTATFDVVLAAQEQRREATGRAYFMSQDPGEEKDMATTVRAALDGDEQARQRLRQPKEQGGCAVVMWWRAGVGDIISRTDQGNA